MGNIQTIIVLARWSEDRVTATYINFDASTPDEPYIVSITTTIAPRTDGVLVYPVGTTAADLPPIGGTATIVKLATTAAYRISQHVEGERT